MLVQFLLGWMVEAVFGSPAALGRKFERELDAYLVRRGFDAAPGERRATTV
jgi:hypothetical protein